MGNNLAFSNNDLLTNFVDYTKRILLDIKSIMVVHRFFTGTSWPTSQLELNYLGQILISTSTNSFKSSIIV